jgi:hypothetical protein
VDRLSGVREGIALRGVKPLAVLTAHCFWRDVTFRAWLRKKSQCVSSLINCSDDRQLSVLPGVNS